MRKLSSCFHHPGLVVLLLTLATVAASPLHAGETPHAAPAGPELNLPNTPYQYDDETLPEHFRSFAVQVFDTTPANNRLTNEGATLGRVLFYDRRLSANGTIACADCHEQRYAFASADRFSSGFEGKLGDRNSMSLANLRWTRAGFFWDERAATLEQQVLLPLHSRIEMGQEPGTALPVLQEDPRYAPLFEAAFGSAEISEERVARALAQFVRSLVSARSRFDEGFLAAGRATTSDFPNFTAAENRGKTLFLQDCASCHTLGQRDEVVLFAMFRSLTNGIDANTQVADTGRGDVTMIPSDAGHFKASDLRNIEHTAPYMHDGRFATLEEVIDHYSTAVMNHPSLGPVSRFQYSDDDKTALVAFLKTLSDPAFLSDPRFSNPWKYEEGQSGSRTVAGSDIGNDALAPAGTAADIAAQPASLSPEVRARLVAERKGLPLGQVRAWLADLDRDGDGALAPEEYRVIAQTEALRLATRPGRDGPRRPRGVEAGGNPTGEEARRLAAYERLMTYGDGGRGEVFLDRFLNEYDLPEATYLEVRAMLSREKAQLRQQQAPLDAAFRVELESVLGPDAFRRLQELILLRETDRGFTRPASEEDVAAAMKFVASFDKNDNDRIDGEELTALARRLESLPGGFAAPVPSRANMIEFHHRIMAYDEDGDGSVTLLEVPERMAAVIRYGDADGDGKVTAEEAQRHLVRTAFSHLEAQGVYIGGGFENVYAQMPRFLPDLNLTDEVRQQAAAMLEDHRQQINALAAAVVARSYPEFTRLIGQR